MILWHYNLKSEHHCSRSSCSSQLQSCVCNSCLPPQRISSSSSGFWIWHGGKITRSHSQKRPWRHQEASLGETNSVESKKKKSILFIEEAEQHRERVRDRHIFHPLTHSPDERWARSTPGAWSSIWISRIHDRGAHTQAVFCCFCRWMSEELIGKPSSPDLSWHSNTEY